MKYIAIIDTDDYKDFEFFEDAIGKYLAVKDAGATASGGWIPLYFKECKQEPKTGQYEKHIDHTDCIWYGNDSGCPVTCSQYRDGWNDAMDYIFKNGKGYQPYRHDS